MRERGSSKIEGLFGEAKEQHGLRRAKYRSSEKMQIQAYLTGITQNLKRFAASLDFYFHWTRFWLRKDFYYCGIVPGDKATFSMAPYYYFGLTLAFQVLHILKRLAYSK